MYEFSELNIQQALKDLTLDIFVDYITKYDLSCFIYNTTPLTIYLIISYNIKLLLFYLCLSSFYKEMFQQ